MLFKNIVVFGCGDTARIFYHRCGSRINIKYFLSNYSGENEFMPDDIHKYEVRRPEPKKRFQKDTGIVICCKDSGQIAEQLMMLGYEPIKDFVDEAIFTFLTSEKKRVLLYGNCHLRALRDALRLSVAFNKEYEAFWYADYLPHNQIEKAQFDFYVENCDVLLYTEMVEESGYRRNRALLERVGAKCRVLSVPTIYFGGYFYQIERPYNRMNRYAIQCVGHNYTPFSYGDSILNHYIDEGKTISEIFTLLLDSKIEGSEQLAAITEKELDIIAYRERNTCIKIAEYIKDHFKERRLFRNETHMENEICLLYGKQVLEKLGIQEDLEFPKEPMFFCSQHPIYPSIAKTLGLKWDVTRERLDLYTYDGWKKVSFEEYISEYVTYCRQIKNLKERGLFPK